jgi:hypothetical protein
MAFSMKLRLRTVIVISFRVPCGRLWLRLVSSVNFCFIKFLKVFSHVLSCHVTDYSVCILCGVMCNLFHESAWCKCYSIRQCIICD